MFIYYSYLFLLGLLFGSFFNVVGLRVPQKQSIVSPRSSCPHCHHTLSPLELIPLFSYLFQNGKCTNCSSRISPLYSNIELLTGVLFLYSGFHFGFSGELVVSLTLISLLMIVFVSDIKYMIIPDKVLLFFLPVFIVLRIIFPLTPWWDMIVGAFVGFGVLFFIALLSKGGMGGGDIKLFGVLGLIMGWKLILFGFFISTLYGSIGGIIGIMTGKVKKKHPIPFGPFIVFGILTAYFFGEKMLKWYYVKFF